ncbi:hypothetical protein I3760_14G053300 [Carya illinoinensis]|nr:hypothetical protein I3760_14G053300 [Carya illinoinensis]
MSHTGKHKPASERLSFPSLMGNHRFTLSDIMPNAWFFKLRDMSRRGRNHRSSHPVKRKQPLMTTTESHKQPHLSPPKSTETHFLDPPRRSSKGRNSRKSVHKSSPGAVMAPVSAGCSCNAKLDSVWTKQSPIQSPTYFVSPTDSSNVSNIHESRLLSDTDSDNLAALDSSELPSCSSSCNCRVRSSASDIILDMTNESFAGEVKKIEEFHTISELGLSPILTKPAKFDDKTYEVTRFRSTSSKVLEEMQKRRPPSVKTVKKESIRTQKEHKASPRVRRSSAISTGIRLRTNSPRLVASRKIQAHARKGLSSRNRSISESVAVEKSSMDPEADFRDSMVEMIVENNIRASKDLEDLLACYLSLNSDEYHDLIVKAFEQIWFDMASLRL